ncbi:MAG: DUF333 domain-containing protein [Candidatus Woesearchaeota archaeon]
MKKIFLVLTILGLLTLFACKSGNTGSTQIANPASVNCVDKGGKLDIITATDGSQQGMCTLTDGTKCEEWAYYRGECPTACALCAQLAPPGPEFCVNGNIIPATPDACGCVGAPTCEAAACTQEAKVCPDGSAVGRVGPNCEFAPCPELERHNCSAESRKAKICTMDYVPVCGWFNSKVRCVKYPCAVTESNGCTACINPNVEYWTTGECPKK